MDRLGIRVAPWKGASKVARQLAWCAAIGAPFYAGCSVERDSISESEFARDANRICIEAAAVVLPERDVAARRADLRQVDRRLKRHMRETLAKLHALDVPSQTRDLVAAWLQAEESAVAASAALLDATREGVTPELERQTARLGPASEDANRLARRVGASECVGIGAGTGY
jgi:hypothetical protein